MPTHRFLIPSVLALSLAHHLGAQGALTPGTASFIAYQSPVIVLQRIRLIDGTGAPARADQTVVIDHGIISSVGAASTIAIPAGAQVIGGS